VAGVAQQLFTTDSVNALRGRYLHPRLPQAYKSTVTIIVLKNIFRRACEGFKRFAGNNNRFSEVYNRSMLFGL
jgi:hypothetical protein